jgi:poly(beta-D-mannuronate) lyase
MSCLYLKRALVFSLLLVIFAFSARATVYNVSNSSGLSSALSSVNPGDSIVLANGNYSGFTVTRSGTVGNLITIEAANQGQAFITSGIINLSDVAYVTVNGLNVTTSGGSYSADGTSVDVEMGLNGATNCRITRCTFDPPTNTFPANTFFTYLSGLCLSNRIDHCEFGWYTNSGDHAVRTSGNVTINGVTPPSDRTPWAFGYGPYNPQMARYTRIDHNYFHDHYTPGANGGETIQLGAIGDTGDYQNIYSLVEYNLFVNCNGDPEIISVKSSSNTLRYNTVRTSAAVFSLRAGNGDIVDGNFFLCAGSGGGIKLCEHDHKIYNNYIENTDDSNYPLMLESGNLYNFEFSHAEAFRVQIAHNTVVSPGRQVLLAHSGVLPTVDCSFANNIITGSGTLYSEDVTPVNPFRTQNIIFGYTPSQSGFIVENPLLTATDPEKLSASSPAIGKGNTNYYSYVTEDMDGQPRTIPRDIGADEYDTTDFIARAPLTTNDVGPNAVDVELSATPSSQSVNIGATNVSYTINVTSDLGFSSPITLTVTGMQPGMIAGFNPVSVSGSGTVTLNVTNSGSLIGGSYPLTVNATGSNFTSTITVMVQVGRGLSNLRWASTSSGAWDVQTSANWFNISSNTTDIFYNGDTVLLDDTPGVQTNLTIAANVVVSPSIITNNSSTNNFTISGSGQNLGATAIVKTGSSTLMLNTTNLFSGGITAAGGILKAGNPYALGGQGGFVIVTNGATLDVNGNNLGMDTILVSGAGVSNNGAIINSGVTASPALALVELNGNTTIGGTNRWDLRASGGTTGNSGTASLSTSGNAYSLTKVGTNFIGIVSVTVDPGLGNINVEGGTLDIEGNTTGLGNPADTLTVYSNATLYLYNDFYATNQILAKVIALDNGSFLQNANGTNYLIGSMTLSGNDTFNIGGTWLTISNNISGSGNLIKTGNAPLFLSGVNTYTGNTTVSNGMLTVEDSLSGSPISLITGTTLSVLGTLTEGNDGIMGPGGSVLALTNSTLQFSVSNGSTNAMIGTLALGGAGNTIEISSFPAGVTPPAQFPLIKYVAENGTFNFNNLVLPTGYFGFISNNLANNSVDVVLTSLPGTFIWDGGSATDNFWSDQNNWGGTPISANAVLYFGGNNRLVNTNDTTAGTTYNNIEFVSGAGPFALNGNVITLSSNILNLSANCQTDNVPMDVGGNCIFNSGTNGLILGGGITNTSATFYTIHLQGTNGTLASPLQSSVVRENLGINVDYLAGASNAWAMTGNNVSYLTNLTVAGGSMTFGTGSDSPSLAMTNTSFALQLGTTTNVTGVFNMNSGTLTINNSAGGVLEMGPQGSLGIFNMNGGTFNVSGKYIQIGDTGGKGILNQIGGTVNATPSGDFILGNQTNATGILNLSGGTFNLPSSAFVGFRGSGTWNISGNGLMVVSTTMNMVRNSSDSLYASGTVNLNGGTLVINGESMGTQTGQTGAVNFNGGVLQAGASSESFLSPATSPAIFMTTVKAGGAFINDGGFAISITTPLLHDSTLGATADGGLTKSGAGTLTLTAANTYSGATTIGNGTLALSGSASISSCPLISIQSGAMLNVASLTGGGLVLGAGQTLTGSGTVSGNLTASSGATFAPGGSLTMLTLNNNVTLNSGSTTSMELNKALQTNDSAQVAGSLAYGGALVLTNFSGSFANGDAFKLFTAGSYSGAFTAITPVIPDVNLVWNTNTLNTDGTLRIVSAPTPSPGFSSVTLSGGNVVFSGTNGPALWPYSVLGTTNITLPLSQWTPMTTNAFDASGNFNFTDPANVNAAQMFYLLKLQ